MNFSPVDTVAAAAGYLSREFGSYGYSLRIVSSGFTNTLFELRHADGSRRLFLVDRYGNVELGPVDLDSDGDWREWCRNAADSLYVQRNGYATTPYTATT